MYNICFDHQRIDRLMGKAGRKNASIIQIIYSDTIIQ